MESTKRRASRKRYNLKQAFQKAAQNGDAEKMRELREEYAELVEQEGRGYEKP